LQRPSERAGANSELAPFELKRVVSDGDVVELQFGGELRAANAGSLWRQLRQVRERTGTVRFDLSRVSAIDGAAMALLVHVKTEVEARGGKADLVGASEAIERLVHLYHGDEIAKPRHRVRPRGMLDQIGVATIDVVTEGQLVLAFLGNLVLSLGGVLRRPSTANWRDIPRTMERVGADAVPIVMLINFLVGFVMAFQGANQLKQFGANIFVADLVGLSVARELGPLMTAIIVCGRSGAAFAAELGSMKVGEEVDALKTIGIGPMRFLVLPRALALVLVIPLLTLLADAVGMLGGLIVGITTLDLSLAAYLNETRKALAVRDVMSGVVKSVVFGSAIALVSCQQGLAASGGAEGVGRRTTAAVVTTLFALIILDAIFTVVFHALGI
jgi:phospholipid/cholesterol/gamma-HCH transport system permease protein